LGTPRSDLKIEAVVALGRNRLRLGNRRALQIFRGKLCMPGSSGLSHGALGGHPFLNCSAAVITRVRLHVPRSPFHKVPNRLTLLGIA